MSGFRIRKLEGTSLYAIGAGYYSPKLNAAARTVPGIRREPKLKHHFIGYPDAIELLVARLRELGLNTDDPPTNDRNWSHNLLVSYEDAREYQKTGIDFLVVTAGSGALLADDMGLGKGFQSIRAARAFRRKTVVVCPSHVRGVWERPKDRAIGEKGGELAKWWPDAKVFRPYGVTPEKIPADADVVVIHYDIIYAWVEAIIAWGRRKMTLILDEAHACMDPESRRSLACQEIRAASLGCIALTGTPPVDRIEDLFGVLQVISPNRFGETFWGYGMRYCDGHETQIEGPDKIPKKIWDWKGRSNVAELRKRLDWFTLRRTKREVMAELPKMTRQIVDVEVPARARIAMSARLVGDKRQMRAALDSAADGKLKSTLELIRGHLADGLRVVVATYRRAMCEKIADVIGETSGVPTKFIHGGLSRVKRDKIVAEMRKVEGPCCLVTNIDITATGIDLTFASVGVVAELVWEPKDHLQWESRTHRFGQEEPVLIQYVIARGTGDELVLHAVLNKLDNFLDLVETDAGDGFKETLAGKKDEGLTRLAAALKKMGKKSAT